MFIKVLKHYNNDIIIKLKYLVLILILTLISSCNLSESDISNSTYKSGYYHVEFKKDNSIYIYQKSSGSSVQGCVAEGNWSLKDNLLYLKVTKSFCGSESYRKFNGEYNVKTNSISNGNNTFYKITY
jgi:hypothetical protein